MSPSINNKIVLEDLQYILKGFPEKKQLEGSTFLLTGCAGFLGFYFLHFFSFYAKELGIKRIIALDNFKFGRPSWIKGLSDGFPKILKVRSFDIARNRLSDLKESRQTDYALHMASIASPTYYRRYPLETVDANIWGLRSLLDYMKDKSLKGFLFFSSSEIYGEPAPGFIPTKEDYRGAVSSLGPRACYDESKRFGETLCWIYAHHAKLPIRIVRPFNNYGPGMRLDDRRIPADFAKAVLENKDLVILSDGKPKRTFCYVADAIIGYLKSLVYSKFEVFNIGMDSPEISMKELALIYQKQGRLITGYKGKIKFSAPVDKEYLTHNPSRRCPNIDRAVHLLKFKPSIDVENGVGRYLKFLTQERKS